MLRRLRDLAARQVTFAFESTLATRSYAPWIRELLGQGYRFHLMFLWLHRPELAVQRVQRRVAKGGHDIPQQVIHRRYWRGIRNFFEIYQPLATTWAVYDNSASTQPVLAATGTGQGVLTVHHTDLWYMFSYVL